MKSLKIEKEGFLGNVTQTATLFLVNRYPHMYISIEDVAIRLGFKHPQKLLSKIKGQTGYQFGFPVAIKKIENIKCVDVGAFQNIISHYLSSDSVHPNMREMQKAARDLVALMSIHGFSIISQLIYSNLGVRHPRSVNNATSFDMTPDLITMMIERQISKIYPGREGEKIVYMANQVYKYSISAVIDEGQKKIIDFYKEHFYNDSFPHPFCFLAKYKQQLASFYISLWIATTNRYMKEIKERSVLRDEFKKYSTAKANEYSPLRFVKTLVDEEFEAIQKAVEFK